MSDPNFPSQPPEEQPDQNSGDFTPPAVPDSGFTPPPPPPGGAFAPPPPPPPPPGGDFTPPPPPPGGFTPPPPPPPGGGFTPPPPPGGFTPPPPPGGQYEVYGQMGADPSVGAAFRYGFEKFKQNWAIFVGATVAMFAVGVVFFLIRVALVQATQTCTPTFAGGEVCTSGGLLLTVGTQILSSLVLTIGTYFVLRAALAVVNGQPLTAATVFDFGRFGPFLITGIITGIAGGIGFVLCIVPGIVLSVLFFYSQYFVVDQNQSPIEAIKSSIALARSNVGPTIVIAIVGWLASIIGLAACCVGILVAAPVVQIATAYTYKAVSNQPVAP